MIPSKAKRVKVKVTVMVSRLGLLRVPTLWHRSMTEHAYKVAHDSNVNVKRCDRKMAKPEHEY